MTAALKKGDQEDTLVFPNGQTLSLGRRLPYAEGEGMIVYIARRADPSLPPGRVMAKHILQEILSGSR